MNTDLAQGLGLVVLLAAVRGAHIRQAPGGQCPNGPVMNQLYENCFFNSTGFQAIRGIWNSYREGGPIAFTANYVIDVFEENCRELPEMTMCVLSGIPSCEDSVQKLKVDEAFAERSTICEAKSWIKELFKIHGDNLLANPTCVEALYGMLSSCYEETGDMFRGMDSSTSMSVLIDTYDTVRSAIAACLVSPNYEMLPHGCDSKSAQTFAAFMAMDRNFIAPPGFSFTSEQLQDIHQMA